MWSPHKAYYLLKYFPCLYTTSPISFFYRPFERYYIHILEINAGRSKTASTVENWIVVTDLRDGFLATWAFQKYFFIFQEWKESSSGLYVETKGLGASFKRKSHLSTAIMEPKDFTHRIEPEFSFLFFFWNRGVLKNEKQEYINKLFVITILHEQSLS